MPSVTIDLLVWHAGGPWDILCFLQTDCRPIFQLDVGANLYPLHSKALSWSSISTNICSISFFNFCQHHLHLGHSTRFFCYSVVDVNRGVTSSFSRRVTLFACIVKPFCSTWWRYLLRTLLNVLLKLFLSLSVQMVNMLNISKKVKSRRWFLNLRLSEDLNSCSMLRHWVYAINHITSQEFRWVKFCTAFLHLQSAL